MSAVLFVGEPAHRWAPGFFEFVGLLALLALAAFAVLVLVDDHRARRRMLARQAARRAEELDLQEAERKARADARAERFDTARRDALAAAHDRTGVVEIVPDATCPPLDKATAYRDVAALDALEGEFQ